jgi:hypothetical protein
MKHLLRLRRQRQAHVARVSADCMTVARGRRDARAGAGGRASQCDDGGEVALALFRVRSTWRSAL